MSMRLLITLGIILGSPSLVFAGEILPPNLLTTTYHCPQLSSPFTVGGKITVRGEVNDIFPWFVDSVGSLEKGSIVIMDSADTYKYTSNEVFNQGLLRCHGILTMNGKSYDIRVSTLAIGQCNVNSSDMTFTCNRDD